MTVNFATHGNFEPQNNLLKLVLKQTSHMPIFHLKACKHCEKIIAVNAWF